MSFDEKVPKLSTPERYDYVIIENELTKRGWRLPGENDVPKPVDGFILRDIFSRQFERLNPELKGLEGREREDALDEVNERLKNEDERRILRYLKDGMKYTLPRKAKTLTFKFIDYNNPENNDYLLAPQAKFEGTPENIKPDYTLFINGLPVAIIEVKSSTRIDSYEEALDQIHRYEEESPELFRFVQLGIAYGDEKVYIPTWPNRNHEKRHTRHFVWKSQENGELKENIFELLKPETLLKIIKFYTFFTKDKSSKIIARYNQFYASEKALERISEHLEGKGRNRGLIWHWQGSGKTYTMLFIANKFFETYFDRNPVVFFLLDREDLQKQLLEDFVSKLDVDYFSEYLKKIDSISELKDELENIRKSTENQNIKVRKMYVVLIQKFRKEDFEDPIGRGIPKREVVFLIDEAHRSQYGTLASVMKNLFPDAVRFAFTGTPVFKYEEKNTFREFGYEDEPYMDVYFIQQSIDDGFTLPIVYDVINEGKKEAEGIKILLSDRDIENFIQNWKKLSDEEYDEFMEEAKPAITRRDIATHLNPIKVILTNERRIEKLAGFIADRISQDTEGFRYKAMVVMANRESCVMMKKYLDDELSKRFGANASEWSEIVMTYMQNDTGKILECKGKLREKWNRDYDEINRAIQDAFKKKVDPRILIVTDMLITGFDAPKLRVMYLDKPLYDHRLLQAIARVNRPYRDGLGEKKNGLIVDSVGLLAHLKKSIENYEILSDERTSKDLLKNVFYDLDSMAKDFAENLDKLKKELKELKIDGQDLSLDIDRFKSIYKTRKNIFETLAKDEIISKVKKMVLYWDQVDIMRKMHEVIEEFKALGPHKDRIKYEDDVVLIQYIYDVMLKIIKKGSPPKEFWDELIELVHDKTGVKDFRTISDYIIGKQTLEQVYEKIKSKSLDSEEIADAFGVLRSFLLDELANPVYRAIYERLEEVRKEWVSRHNDKELDEELKDLFGKAVEYRKETEGLALQEYIAKTVAKTVTASLKLEGQNLELKNFKAVLQAIAGKRIIGEGERKRIRTELLKDLFKEIKNADRTKLNELAEEMAEFAINKIRAEKH
jgi:type I restriction enzyme R subunit